MGVKGGNRKKEKRTWIDFRHELEAGGQKKTNKKKTYNTELNMNKCYQR